ncbi:threonine transporter RhtB [Pantoea sp. YR343]|uniref:ABC-three component system middle component 2 n=1 Tax=Pantoea sp. YR343 TaxID=1144341 RepID=UPI000271071F|nr:ABC-three component system middle component 2 [Pantoea sp. YR343]KAJ9430807.1 threonine transporter RhtB [Pantoea sp. YR343]KAJ9431865.1 threonine transporter RhtB [Pantoea sp. YR343]
MSEVFNSPFELGVRMVYILLSLYPRKADLQKLVYLDYATIYSEDLGGPSSLHTPVPMRGGEYICKRGVIEEGLYIMSLRSLVEVSYDSTGVYYSAGDNSPSLIGLIGGDYSEKLLSSCDWVAKHFGNFNGKELSIIFNNKSLTWGAEFSTPISKVALNDN